MPKSRLPKELRDRVRKYVGLHEEAREATNLANREKTQLRNFVKDYWTSNQIPMGSYIHTDGVEVRYEATISEEIDADAVLAMYENGEIERDQMVRMLKIDKRQAGTILGGDLVADLTQKNISDKADIRMERLPVEQHNDTFLHVARSIKRKVFKSKYAREAEAGRQRVKPKRNIKMPK